MKKWLFALLILAAPSCFASSYNAVSVTSTQTTILPASRNRAGWLIHNVSTSTVYLGTDTSVTTATGLPLLPGEKITNDGPFGYNQVIKGIGASSTASEIRYLEWSHSEVTQ